MQRNSQLQSSQSPQQSRGECWHQLQTLNLLVKAVNKLVLLYNRSNLDLRGT